MTFCVQSHSRRFIARFNFNDVLLFKLLFIYLFVYMRTYGYTSIVWTAQTQPKPVIPQNSQNSPHSGVNRKICSLWDIPPRYNVRRQLLELSETHCWMRLSHNDKLKSFRTFRDPDTDPNDFYNLTVTSLSKDTSLVKFLRSGDQ